VQFFISNDTRSLNLLLHEMLRRSIPAFLDKYLTEPSLPFEPDTIRRYAKDVIDRKGNFYAEGWRLAECMAIAMFARQCRDPEADNFDTVRKSSAGPPLIPQSQWKNMGALFENVAPANPISWSPNDRLALPQGVQVLVPIENAQSFQLASEGTIYSSITVPKHLDWVGKMLRHLQNEETRNFTLNDWADEFDVDQRTLMAELEVLHLAGFIERNPAT